MTQFIQRTALTLCGLALLGGSALAQSSLASQSSLIDASKLDGKKVTNLQGEEIGDVQQVLVDPRSGRARFAIIQPNRNMQPGAEEIAVPFGALKMSGKPSDPSFRLTLDASREKIASAPKVRGTEIERLYSREASAPIYTYWSVSWFEDPSTSESGTTPPSGTSSPGTSTDPSSPSSTR